MLDIKSLFQAMIPNRNSPLYNGHPLIKLLGAFIVLITLIICSLPIAILVLILVRLIAGSIAFLNVYLTTRMLDLEQALEKMGLPASIVRILSLTVRLIPLSIRDAEQSVEALLLRGIYGGGFKGVVPLAALIMANSLDRVEFLTEALVAKQFMTGKKNYPWKLKLTQLDVVFFALKIACFLLSIPIYW